MRNWIAFCLVVHAELAHVHAQHQCFERRFQRVDLTIHPCQFPLGRQKVAEFSVSIGEQFLQTFLQSLLSIQPGVGVNNGNGEVFSRRLAVCDVSVRLLGFFVNAVEECFYPVRCRA